MAFSFIEWLKKLKSYGKPQLKYEETADFYYDLQKKYHPYRMEVGPEGLIYRDKKNYMRIIGIAEIPKEYTKPVGIAETETVCFFLSPD